MENWKLTWTKLVSLDQASVNNLANNLPGVYRLSFKSDDGNFYVFYVGQANDIKKRLQEHINQTEMNVCIKNYVATKPCYFRYAKITQSFLRDATEKQTYKKYEPVCNLTEPSGRDDISINLT